MFTDLRAAVGIQTVIRRGVRVLLLFSETKRGATAIECGLIAAGVAVAMFSLTITLGDEIATLFQSIF